MKETSIHQHFKDLKDPRVNRSLKHPLIHVIFIAFCAILCGAEDWVAIERFGLLRREWFKQFLVMEHDAPSLEMPQLMLHYLIKWRVIALKKKLRLKLA